MKTTDLKLFAVEYINLQEASNDDKLQLMAFVYESSREEVISLLFTGMPRSLEEGEDRFVSELFNVSKIGGFLTENLTEAEEPATVASMFSQAAHGKEALAGSEIIKGLASKWASFKIPNVKEVPAWLGGGVASTGDRASSWGKHYNQAIDALNKGVPVAAAVVAALVIMLARKAYKAYFTKAARACKGTKGQEKNDCIKKFKIDAIKAQIGVLGQAKSACKAAKSPDKCTAKIDQKIQKKQVDAKKLAAKKKVR